MTDEQAWHLKRNRIDLETVRGKGHASKLLDVIFKDQKIQLASAKVIGYMRAKGAIGPHDTATIEQGRKFFAENNRRQSA